MAQKGGQGGQQSNPLFGSAWAGKYCPVELAEYLGKDLGQGTEYADAIKLAGQESLQAVKDELAPTGLGIVAAINKATACVDQLQADGRITPAVADNLRALLAKLKDNAVEDIKQRASQAAKAGQKTDAKKVSGVVAVAQALATIRAGNDDTHYGPEYHRRLTALLASLTDPDKRRVFYQNCAELAGQPDIDIGDDIKVPPLCLALVQFAWTDNSAQRKLEFESSALLQEATK